YLDALVFPIADVDVVLGIDSDRVRQVELAGLCATLAPGLDELPVLIEFRDPGVAIAIGDEDISDRVPRHIGRTIEIVTRDARARRSTASTASAFASSAFASSAFAFTTRTCGDNQRFGFPAQG